MSGKEGGGVPEWAAPIMGDKEFQMFMSAVEGYFKKRGEPYDIGDKTVKLRGKWDFGLVNIAQVCAQGKPADYPAIVDGHFQSAIGSMEFNEEFERTSDDFDSVRQYIATRLHDIGYLNTVPDAFTHRPFAGELCAALSYDLPHVVQNIPRRNIDKWGKAEDELFSIGIENVRRNYPLETERVELGGDEILVVDESHLFASNLLFELGERKDLVGKGGAIVASPNRHIAMVYPIESMKVINVLSAFFRIVPGLFSKGPGSLTSEIYWYQGGRFERLDYEPGPDIKFRPSEGFMELINGGLEQ